MFTALPASAEAVYAIDFKHEISVSEANYTRVAQKKISPSEAKAIARRKVRDAEVIDVSPSGDVYIVRMQKKNGQVVDVKVDAVTGRVR
jgi:uncharacterized membrane protein YkoI